MSRIYLPISVLILILVVGIFLTGIFHLYDSVRLFDKYMHLAGGFVVAWFAYVLWKNSIESLSWFNRLIFLSGIVALVGVAWEIAEYYAHYVKDIFPTLYYYFHGGGLPDTLADMVANVLGGAIFAIIWGRKTT